MVSISEVVGAMGALEEDDRTAVARPNSMAPVATQLDVRITPLSGHSASGHRTANPGGRTKPLSRWSAAHEGAPGDRPRSSNGMGACCLRLGMVKPTSQDIPCPRLPS